MIARSYVRTSCYDWRLMFTKKNSRRGLSGGNGSKRLPMGASLRGLCALALSLSLVPLYAVPAAAQVVETSRSSAVQDVPVVVSGMDFRKVSESPVEIAAVENLGGESLWSDISVDGKEVATNLEYSYDDPSDCYGVMSISSGGTDIARLSGKLSVKIYDEPVESRTGEDSICDLSVHAIYADCGDDEVLIAYRSAVPGDEPDLFRTFRAPRIVYTEEGSRTWALNAFASDIEPLPSDDGSLHIPYRAVPSDAVSGVVVYRDANGNIVETEEIADIGRGALVGVLDEIVANGVSYRSQANTGCLWLSADSPLVEVPVVPVSTVDDARTVVPIRYFGEGGEALMSESVLVGAEGVLYSPPRVFSQVRDGKVVSWTLSECEANGTSYKPEDDGLTLALSRDSDTAITLVYTPSPATVPYKVSLGIVRTDGNGALSTEIVDTLSYSVSDVSPAEVSVPRTFTANDGTVCDMTGSTGEWSWTLDDYIAGSDPYCTVWYADEGARAAAAPYDLEIRAVNASDGSVIASKTVEVGLESGALVDLADDITADGVHYMKLPGQSARSHSYFSDSRVETVWYRAEGDSLYERSTSHRTDIIDDGAASAPGGQSMPSDGGAAGSEDKREVSRWKSGSSFYTLVSSAESFSETEGADSVAQGAAAEGDVRGMGDALNGEGQTLLQVQLDDSPVPMAHIPSGDDKNKSENIAMSSDGEMDFSSMDDPAVVFAVVALVLVIGGSAIAMTVFKKRKERGQGKNKEKETADEE